MRILTYFSLLVCGYGVFINGLDLLLFLEAPDDYSMVYLIGPDNEHWQFKSAGNFLKWKTVLVILFAFHTAISLSYLIRPGFYVGKFRRSALLCTFITTLFAVVWEIRSHLIWIRSGYDHYPGFDPYIL